MSKCTCIKLKTVDQRLSIVQQPVLASGDVGTVRVEYELDGYWEGYTPSGTFYTGKNPEDIYEQPLTSGACVVPWEALQEDGVLYIGLRGVDGTGLVKTAAPVRYRVEKGSPCGNGTTAEPTPDVYQQLLAAYGEQSARMDAIFSTRTGAVITTHHLEQTPEMENWNCHAYIVSNGVAAVAIVENFHPEISDIELPIPDELYPADTVTQQINNSFASVTTGGDLLVSTEAYEGGGWRKTFTIVYPLMDVRLEELNDVRLGADGVKYDSAGDAVRVQINNLIEALNTKATLYEEIPAYMLPMGMVIGSENGPENVLVNSGIDTRKLNPTVKLIASGTTTEEVAAIYVSDTSGGEITDDMGAPVVRSFELKDRIYIRITCPAVTVKANIIIKLNDTSLGQIANSTDTTKATLSRFDAFYTGGGNWSYNGIQGINGNSISNTWSCVGYKGHGETVHLISIVRASNNIFPVGTTYEVYGIEV